MFGRKSTESDSVTYPAVSDTDQAVAAKLRDLAGGTSNPDLAATWNKTAAAAEAGELHPSLRADFARGTTFRK